MKKLLSIPIIFLIAFSTLAAISPKANAHEPPEQLTTNPDKDCHPSWHPDGTKIVYTAFSGSWHRNIWVMNNDETGSGKTPLTFGNAVNEAPAFSPDGTMIVFQHWGFRGDYLDLMLMNADGTGIIRLTDDGIPGMVEGTYHEPQWSQDGSKLVFSYGEGTTGEYKRWWVCTVDFVAGDIDEGDIDCLDRGLNPVFCHDDTKILFTRSFDLHFGDMRIARMNVDGTGLEDYLSDGPTDYQPDCSPFNNRIVFTRGWEVGDLYLMDADGSNVDLLWSNGERNYMASWSPDGEYIAYASGIIGVNYDIWKIHVQIGGLLPATVNIDPDTLNLKSNGQWITAYITLPEGHNVEHIVLETVEVEGIPAEWSDIQDGVYMAKFDRASVQAFVSGEPDYDSAPKSYEITLTVTGELADGTIFEGNDTIAVLKK